MLRQISITCLLAMLLLTACGPKTGDKSELTENRPVQLPLTEKELADKVFGMLAGSAIGDAMGAPTEMWPREDINAKYGWVDRLDTMVREVSPEGIWIPNLPAGGTTDDTRWKKVIVEYLISESGLRQNPANFAKHILAQHAEYQKELNQIDATESTALVKSSLRVAWLDEWAKVSKPYLQGDFIDYNIRLSTFYGGEMVCAGLLYSQVIGALFPGQPDRAYLAAFDLAIFDVGYARDISALSAAMTAAAMHPEATPQSIVNVINEIDPHRYMESRLVGRTAQRILRRAEGIVEEIRGNRSSSSPENRTAGSLSTEEMRNAFLLLDHHLQDMPFHAGEIFLQVLTALLLTDFDFELTIQFLVNFGRDNDTTAAIAGSILGAYWGLENLPQNMYKQTISVNETPLDIDLIRISQKLTEKIRSEYVLISSN